MTLGEKIQQLRKDAGLSQQQFAQKFHVTRQTVSNWENDRNYPDIASLRQISDEFGISFDILLKEDAAYIRSIDEKVKKEPLLRRVLLALALLILLMIAGFCLILHIASQATPEGRRINSDTDIRMLTYLDGETPSRAITYTTDVENDDHGKTAAGLKDSSDKIKKYIKSSLGKVEGDIPAVFLDENPTVTLRFQDLDHHDAVPDEVMDVSAELYDLNSDDPAPITVHPEFRQDDGAVKIKIDPTAVPANETDGYREIFCDCVIIVKYQYQGRIYAGVTAVGIADTAI